MKSKTSKILAGSLGTLAISLLFGTVQSHAQGISLGVYPPIIQINAKPPASIDNPISLENSEDRPMTYNIGYKIFKPRENGDIEYVQGPLSSIFQKMQVLDSDHVVTQVTLAPKQKKTLDFHVGITPDEKPGDYYFSVLFISNQPSNIESTQSQASLGVATNVLLSVGPTGPTTGQIEEFSSPVFVEKGPVPFRVKIKNTSDHYITPSGVITIKNVFGQTVGKVDLLSVNVLSNSSRIIPAAKEDSVADPKASWNEKFLLGPYTAKIIVGLSEEGPIYNKTITFFAFPLELLVGILVSIIIVIIIVKRIREKQKTQS